MGKFIAGKVLAAGSDAAKKNLVQRWNAWRARHELARICQRAMDGAIAAVPQLQPDLCSDSFISHAVVPVVTGVLVDPSSSFSAEQLRARYLEMFVAPYAAGGLDAALGTVFLTDRENLTRALDAFLNALKTELYASKHWQEHQSRATIEASSAKLDRIGAMVEAGFARGSSPRLGVAEARLNAKAASAEMQEWPTTILGRTIETPALDRVLAHVAQSPDETLLLVGDAGTGKSALFARLIPALEERGITPIAIKADQLPAGVHTVDDVAVALGAATGMDDWIGTLAEAGPIALLIDQMDAVSSIMDRQSQRMQLLLRLIRKVADQRREGASIAILVSSRPFEAAHDARFAQLKAQEIRLDHLEPERVEAFLKDIGVDVDSLDKALLTTLQRPFALKLFAELDARGDEVRTVRAGELLDRWLASADLGAPDERREAMRLMTALAEEMVSTETLWRPADRFEDEFLEALRRCEACGLVLRDGARIGFSHQSWLDDFQAKMFTNGADLAEYVWDRQDSLFVRASILRGLQRLRSTDARAYEIACLQLLSGARTRRHVLHLIADIMATSPEPLPFEAAWVERWAANDAPLARRALSQIVAGWAGWRPLLKTMLPDLMADPDLRWQAVRLLAEELKIDPDHTADLVERYWGSLEHDQSVFDVIEQAATLGTRIRERLSVILGRTQLPDHSVAHLVTTLREKSEIDQALEVLVLWLQGQTMEGRSPSLYGLEELAKVAPVRFVEAALPWMVDIGTKDADADSASFVQYPRSRAFRSSRLSIGNEGSIFDAFDIALDRAAKNDPDGLWRLLQPLTAIEVDDVQEIVVKGLAAAGARLADTALGYLLDDPRRLSVSDVIGSERGSVITSRRGWHVAVLVSAIVESLEPDQVGALRDAIEAWTVYTPEALADGAVRERLRWADEARFPLLTALPAGALEPRRRRQVKEWTDRQPSFTPDLHGTETSGWIGPRMTNEEMAKGSDADVVRILDEVNDGTPDDIWSHPLERSGGTRALAQAFAAFGKECPERAMGIARRHFRSGRHEMAAGMLVREVASEEKIDPEAVRDLVVELCGRGFASGEWRQDAAYALDRVAVRSGGLPDDLIDLLLSWVERNPEVIEKEVGERLEFERLNAQNDKRSDETLPILFGRGSGGADYFPQHNFTILSAVASGLFNRKPASSAQWAEILRQHVAEPEDPVVWLALLRWRYWGLFHADRACVEVLLDAVFDAHPELVAKVRVVDFLWPLRLRVSDRLLDAAIGAWLDVGTTEQQQAAAEFVVAAHLLDPEVARYRSLFSRLDMKREPIAIGALFAAALGWREKGGAWRAGAHAVLMTALPTVSGRTALAISTAVGTGRRLPPDEETKELLAALCGIDAVLEASINGNFVEGLQSLLVFPGFDGVVLDVADRVAALMRRKGGRFRHAIAGRELVQVAVALQRNEGPLRVRAMDVYENLLDAEVYGAEEAARAAVGR